MKRTIARASVWTRVPWQAFAIAAVVVPTLGVLVARQVLAQRGPRAAQASIITPAGEQAGVVSREVPGRRGAAEAATLRIMDEYAGKPFARSPLAQPRLTAKVGEEPAVPSEIRFTGNLTSILQTSQGTVALIGGKLRRVGDRLGTTWELTSLDPDAGTAKITHGSGVTQTLTMRRNLDNLEKR
jgi:hypothetical protein